jgi:hypothetical protein
VGGGGGVTVKSAAETFAASRCAAACVEKIADTL